MYSQYRWPEQLTKNISGLDFVKENKCKETLSLNKFYEKNKAFKTNVKRLLKAAL